MQRVANGPSIILDYDVQYPPLPPPSPADASDTNDPMTVASPHPLSSSIWPESSTEEDITKQSPSIPPSP